MGPESGPASRARCARHASSARPVLAPSRSANGSRGPAAIGTSIFESGEAVMGQLTFKRIAADESRIYDANGDHVGDV